MPTRPSVPQHAIRVLTRTALLAYGLAGLALGFAAPIGGVILVATAWVVVSSLFTPGKSVAAELASLYGDLFGSSPEIGIFGMVSLLLAAVAVALATVWASRRIRIFGSRRAFAITALAGASSWLLPFAISGFGALMYWSALQDLFGYRAVPHEVGVFIASAGSAVLMAVLHAGSGLAAMRLFAHWLRPRTWPEPSMPAPAQPPIAPVVLLCPLHHQTEATHASHEQLLARWMRRPIPEGTAPAAPAVRY